MKQNKFSRAMGVIIKELRDDKQYYYAWQSNIAAQFQDTLFRAGYQFPELHKLSYDAAKSFLDMLILKSPSGRTIDDKGNK
jgi:hypothetical protein